MGQRSLAETGRTIDQDMIQRLIPGLGSLQEDPEVFLDTVLPDILVQGLGAQADVQPGFFPRSL